MSNRSKTKSTSDGSKNLPWIPIFVSAITAIGAVIVAYFQYYLPLKTSISATQTADTKLASSIVTTLPTFFPSPTNSPIDTPKPRTGTPTLIPTNIPTPTVSILPTSTQTTTFVPGQDFELSCIDSKFWVPYRGETHSKDRNGCWQLADWGISAQDGELLLAVENSGGISRSIYTNLPDKAEISFTVQIDRLTTEVDRDTSLVFGIGNSMEWLQSGKLLIYRVITPESPIYTLYTSSITRAGDRYFPNYSRRNEQKVIFLVNGLLLDMYIDDLLVLESITLSPSDKEVFWIGFWPSVGGDVVVRITDFRLFEK